MARITCADCKKCRREGQKLFLKGERCTSKKCAMERRPVAPGQHGASRKKNSEYAVQLREKQKAKFIYGVLEKPFRNYYEKADRMKGMTGENLMTLLESRLDNVVFRMGFARTRREARQIVDHKHVLVNGKCVNIPSYLIKAGDVIEIKESAKSMQRYKDILDVTAGRLVPEWIDADVENFKGTIKNLPTREMIDVPVDEMLIVELYSK
jgi:small subunit ribosomal protein S4